MQLKFSVQKPVKCSYHSYLSYVQWLLKTVSVFFTDISTYSSTPGIKIWSRLDLFYSEGIVEWLYLIAAAELAKHCWPSPWNDLVLGAKVAYKYIIACIQKYVNPSSAAENSRANGNRFLFIPRHTIVARYYGFKLDVRVSVCLSVRPSVSQSVVCPSVSQSYVRPFFVSGW